MDWMISGAAMARLCGVRALSTGVKDKGRALEGVQAELGIGPAQTVAMGDDLPDLDAVALGELVVALVVRRHGHDRSGAIPRQDIVGDPDRNPLAVDGIDRVAAGKDAGLHTITLGPFAIALEGCLLAIRLDLAGMLRRRQCVNQGVLR